MHNTGLKFMSLKFMSFKFQVPDLFPVIHLISYSLSLISDDDIDTMNAMDAIIAMDAMVTMVAIVFSLRFKV